MGITAYGTCLFAFRQFRFGGAIAISSLGIAAIPTRRLLKMSDQNSFMTAGRAACEITTSDVARIAVPIKQHGSIRTIVERGFRGVMHAIPALLGLGDDVISVGSDR